jgi:gas vesicle protein
VHHDLGQIFLKTEVKVEDDKYQEESQEEVATKGESENHLTEVKEEVDNDFVEKVKEVKGIGNEGIQNELVRVKEEFVQVKEEIDPVKEEVEQEPSVLAKDPLAR